MPSPEVSGSSTSTIADILAKLGSDPTTVLNPAQAQERLSKYGPNALAEEKKSALSGLATMIAWFSYGSLKLF